MASIYIHVPFCRRRCPYCDFYFVVGKPKHTFISAISAEWNYRKNNYIHGPADTIYFGGGTPSLLSPQEIEELIQIFPRHEATEITLEANPEDLTQDYIAALSQTPINRISLGVQSFDDDILRHLGRKHSQKTAQDGIKNLLAHGFSNISIDLIVGIEGQNEQEIIKTLHWVAEQQIPHISAYLLTIEKQTKFFKLIEAGKMRFPDDDLQARVYRQIQKKLKSLGYIQYDISSYAKQSFFSKHNQNYWAGNDYIGLGPSAHSMRLLKNGSIERLHNTAQLNQWLKDPLDQNPLSLDLLQPADALKESLAFGLRNMFLGINPQNLALKHQENLPKNFFKTIEKYKQIKYLTDNSHTIKINQKGALFADSIMGDILCG